MTRIAPPAELASLLEEYRKRGGVLEFAFYGAKSRISDADSHRNAARQFLNGCATPSSDFAKTLEYNDYPLARPQACHFDESKLCGTQISFEQFWGADDVTQKQILRKAWSIPNIDGYKTAFFHPPHGLDGGVPGNTQLFESINEIIFVASGKNALSIWSWSTDCSSYFEDGQQWWGAFLWTMSLQDSTTLTLIAASATD